MKQVLKQPWNYVRLFLFVFCVSCMGFAWLQEEQAPLWMHGCLYAAILLGIVGGWTEAREKKQMCTCIAEIRCKKCGKVLTKIKSCEKPRPDAFIQQGTIVVTYDIESMFCDDCINKRNDE